MFNIGDKVVYPYHGAGVIEAIEEKEVLEGKRKYYVIRMVLGDMRVMVPIEKTEINKIRHIISEDKVDEIYYILSGETSCMCKNWSRRYRENEDKIRGGDVFKIAELVKNLTVINRGKKLSGGEKRMLENAEQLLISELMLVLDKTYDKIEEVVHKLIK